MSKKYNSKLSQNSWIKVNKILIQKFGINAAIVKGELQWLSQYHKKREHLSSDEYFQETYEQISRNTMLTKNQVVAAIKVLQDAGIIKYIMDPKKDCKDVRKHKYYLIDNLKEDEYLRGPNGSVSENTTGKDSFYIYNKNLAKKIGPSAALIYSDLDTTYENYEADGNLVDDQWFRGCVSDVAKRLGISRQILYTHYIKVLKENKLIEQTTIGFPKTTYFKINGDVIDKILGLPIIEETNVNTGTNMSKTERITRDILKKAYDLSKIEWEFDYDKVNDIDHALKSGYTEKDFIKVLEYMYDYYSKEGKLEKRFTFKNLFVKSKIKWALSKIDKDKANEEKKDALDIQANKLLDTIIKEANSISKEFNWTKTNNKLIILKRLILDDVTETELLQLLHNRYDYLTKNNLGYKKFNFVNIYNKNIDKALNQLRHQNNKTIKFKYESKDGVKSDSYTPDQIIEFKRKADQLESIGEQGYF